MIVAVIVGCVVLVEPELSTDFVHIFVDFAYL